MALVIVLLESEASLESVLELMDSGAFDIDFQMPGSRITPLITAIEKDREDVALELIVRGANMDLPDAVGSSPLITACFYNLQSTAQALVRAGVDIDRASLWTPLGLAAVGGHLNTIRAMLSWGADPIRVGTNQETARAVAKRAGHGAVFNFLDACGSILVVRSAEQVHRLSARSAFKRFPSDLGRMVGKMLV
jgi:ankyrin repeat protein